MPDGTKAKAVRFYARHGPLSLLSVPGFAPWLDHWRLWDTVYHCGPLKLSFEDNPTVNIHEYQAKQLLAQHGVAVPRGAVAHTPGEAEAAARQLSGPVWVVKAQIHAGGRGKGGGVKVVRSVADAREAAAHMIGMNLVTHQTGPQGKRVARVYIEEGCSIARELYLGMLIDRACGRLTVIASTEGGMEIEELAATRREKILRVTIDPALGLQHFYARQLAFGLELEGHQVGAAVKFIQAMYSAFVALDSSLIEINPLVVTADGAVVALDAKMNFDDNALFRHPNVAALRDESEEDPTEVEASRHGLNYIKLSGNIGCMVNGAGLAMATMDIIKLHGGEPANFLDVGGGASREQVTKAFKLILSDSNVRGILVNIFGGIMRCDIIAEGVVAAAREVSLGIPLVVRLAGTNVDLGNKILADSGLNIVSANDLADAADKVVNAVGRMR
jgi:succinyl-CoA synthetase beta subunit